MGLISCSNCNRSISGMIGYGGRKKIPRVRYRCHSKNINEPCNVRDINAKYYEKFVLDMINELLNDRNKKKLATLINENMDSFKDYLNGKLDELDKTIEYNASIVNELTVKVTSVRSNADKVLTEQINEYMDIVIKNKNEKMFYEDDLNFLERCYIKDVENRLKYLRELRRNPVKLQYLLRRMISRIYQGNDFVKVYFRLNAFLPYQMYNDFTYMHREYRSNIAFKYNNKFIKPLFK